MDRRARLAVEQTAEVVGADVVVGQVEGVGEVHPRPPFAVAGGEIGAGHRRIVAADPTAQGDLRHHREQGDAGESTQTTVHGRQGSKRAGQPQAQQKQQAERGEPPEQVRGDYLRPELQGHRPHAEDRLGDDHREQQQRQLQRLPRLAATAYRLYGKGEDHQPEGAGEIAMNHLVPALAHLQRCIGKAQRGKVLLVFAHGHGKETVAAGPVRAAEAGVGQPRVGTEQHDHHGQRGGDQGEAVSGSGHRVLLGAACLGPQRSGAVPQPICEIFSRYFRSSRIALPSASAS